VWEARENVREPVTTGFSLTSDWLSVAWVFFNQTVHVEFQNKAHANYFRHSSENRSATSNYKSDWPNHTTDIQESSANRLIIQIPSRSFYLQHELGHYKKTGKYLIINNCLLYFYLLICTSKQFKYNNFVTKHIDFKKTRQHNMYTFSWNKIFVVYELCRGFVRCLRPMSPGCLFFTWSVCFPNTFSAPSSCWLFRIYRIFIIDPFSHFGERKSDTQAREKLLPSS